MFGVRKAQVTKTVYIVFVKTLYAISLRLCFSFPLLRPLFALLTGKHSIKDAACIKKISVVRRCTYQSQSTSLKIFYHREQ